jgi:hypothetical protein
MTYFVRASKENPFSVTSQVFKQGDKLRISVSRNRNKSELSGKVSIEQKSFWSKKTSSKVTASGLRKIKLPKHPRN